MTSESAIEDANATLHCSTSQTATSVDWRFVMSVNETDRQIVKRSEVEEQYKQRFRHFKHGNIYTLVILRARRNDTGLYTCQENGGQLKEHQINFTVLIPHDGVHGKMTLLSVNDVYDIINNFPFH